MGSNRQLRTALGLDLESVQTAVANTRANRRKRSARTAVRLKFYLLPTGAPPPTTKGQKCTGTIDCCSPYLRVW
ncbi:hypothetical protein DPMN_135433 [Dreissena polymorpha]|uniref:Uncharacterized protein n=1 Tax=Dreissena polymorpha TaxID=45954 RepID=A0A9D4FY07_DREPO|nr:hypothetical protein DPMN_135433 [Dreissena polymorpha]